MSSSVPDFPSHMHIFEGIRLRKKKRVKQLKEGERDVDLKLLS